MELRNLIKCITEQLRSLVLNTSFIIHTHEHPYSLLAVGLYVCEYILFVSILILFCLPEFSWLKFERRLTGKIKEAMYFYMQNLKLICRNLDT